MKTQNIIAAVIVASAFILSACGGGGGGSPSVASPQPPANPTGDIRGGLRGVEIYDYRDSSIVIIGDARFGGDAGVIIQNHYTVQLSIWRESDYDFENIGDLNPTRIVNISPATIQRLHTNLSPVDFHQSLIDGLVDGKTIGLLEPGYAYYIVLDNLGIRGDRACNPSVFLLLSRYGLAPSDCVSLRTQNRLSYNADNRVMDFPEPTFQSTTGFGFTGNYQDDTYHNFGMNYKAFHIDAIRLPAYHGGHLTAYRFGYMAIDNKETGARLFVGVDNYNNGILTGKYNNHTLGAVGSGDGYAIRYEYRLNF